MQANADGSAATPLVANRAGQILGMFLVQDSIYWSQRTMGADAEFFRSPIVGVAPVVLSGDSANPVLLGAFGDCVFVTDDQGPLLWRLCTGGDVGVPFQGIVRGFHADGAELFVSAQGQGLFRLATPNNQNLANGNAMGDIEADNTFLYFVDGNGVSGNCTTSGSVFRIPKTGGTPQSIATSQSCIGQLAVDNDAVYWIDSIARQIMKVIKPL